MQIDCIFGNIAVFLLIYDLAHVEVLNEECTKYK